MRLTFQPFDGRSRVHREIVDEDTGETVGEIVADGAGAERGRGIKVSLFGGKYRSARLHGYEECCGFVQGVEAVLRHMTDLPRKKSAGSPRFLARASGSNCPI